jgi:hypothetical protein
MDAGAEVGGWVGGATGSRLDVVTGGGTTWATLVGTEVGRVATATGGSEGGSVTGAGGSVTGSVFAGMVAAIVGAGSAFTVGLSSGAVTVGSDFTGDTSATGAGGAVLTGTNSGAGGTIGPAAGTGDCFIWMTTTLTATSAQTAAIPASHGVICVSRERSVAGLAAAASAFCAGLAEATFFPPAASTIFGSGVRRMFSTALFISAVFG